MTLDDQYDTLKLKLLSGKEKEIKQSYSNAILDITTIAARLPYKQTVFNFRAYPILRKRVDAVLKRMQTEIESAIVNGIDSAWQLSDRKNTVYIDRMTKGLELTSKARKIYYDSHVQVREAFKQEKGGGLGISDRVWKATQALRIELEENIAYGIERGESAKAMAKRIQKYLNQPEEIRDRIRQQNKLADEAKRLGKTGPRRVKVRKAIRDYHPGQGVYRSSYKNALRLARDKINRAYRRADHDRWSSQSFVVGIRISLSNNHPQKPENEMCEQLAGDYPKDFDWTGGWHIQCLCHQTPIFITAAERKERRHAIINGEEWTGKSENEVTDVPANFKRWMKENEDRVARLKSAPDFIADNAKFFNADKPA